MLLKIFLWISIGQKATVKSLTNNYFRIASIRAEVTSNLLCTWVRDPWRPLCSVVTPLGLGSFNPNLWIRVKYGSIRIP